MSDNCHNHSEIEKCTFCSGTGCEPRTDGEIHPCTGCTAKPSMPTTQDALTVALRQYRHNDSDEFVFGYDKGVTDRIVAGLIEDRDQQKDMKGKARVQRNAVVKILNDLVNAVEVIAASSGCNNDALDIAKALIARAKGEVRS